MLFSEIFENAEWVGTGSDYKAQCPYMRQSVCIDGEVGSAAINICGLGFSELYINGIIVSGDMFTPATSDYCERHFRVNGKPFEERLRHRVYYLNYDVAGYLHRGRNTVCVKLFPGWFGQAIESDNDSYARYGDVRLAFLLKVTLADGRRCSFASNHIETSWTAGPVTQYDLFKGETQDMALSHDGWMEADYAAAEFRPTQKLSDMDTVYMLQDCPPDAIIRHIQPRLIASRDGALTYDIGENTTGTPVLRAKGNVGGEVTIRFSEEITPENRLNERFIHAQCARFRLDGKSRTLRAQGTWYGFRYFEVTGPAEVSDCLVIHSDIPVTATFDSDNPALNYLFEAYTRTQLANIHAGIPSDCPHIERRGYTGDGQLVCQSAMLTLDAQSFYRKWMRDIADCQDDLSGHVQYTAPYTRCGGGPGGWGCAIVHVPYCYYLQYGDEEPMRRMLPRMLQYFEYLEAHSENKLIVRDNPGQWCLGDWCTPDNIAIPAPFVNNYFYIKSMREVLDMGEALDSHAHDALLEKRIAERSRAIMDNYFDAATGDFAGNVQGANAFAVDLGLGDARTFENLVRHYTDTGCYDTGIFGTDIVTRVLFERGCAQTAFDLLRSEKPVSFDRLRRLGATTLWEYWAVDKGRSHSHPMFGGVVRYLFEYLLGIRQTGAGWQNIEINPQPVTGLNYIAGSIMTPHGRIGVRINRIDAALIIDVHADQPKGIAFKLGEARYELDAQDTQFVAEA